MRQVTALWLQEFELTLGLTWPVNYWVKSDEQTCHITSIPKERHEVWLTEFAIADPELFLPDIVHELCHAKLAEVLNVGFATIFFAKKYGRLEGRKAKEFWRKAHLLKVAWNHVDIWVNELRHAHWPELTLADHESYVESLIGLASQSRWEILNSRNGVASITLHLAESGRFELGQIDISSVLKGMSKDARRQINTLLPIYRSLIPLSFDWDKDRALLENSVLSCARALHLPIQPQFVQEEGMWVWHV